MPSRRNGALERALSAHLKQLDNQVEDTVVTTVMAAVVAPAVTAPPNYCQL
jgi:hypothetical protein